MRHTTTQLLGAGTMSLAELAPKLAAGDLGMLALTMSPVFRLCEGRGKNCKPHDRDPTEGGREGERERERVSE